MAIIQLRTRPEGSPLGGGPPAASGGATRRGEVYFNAVDQSLWGDTGTTIVPLASPTRQVELTGTQTITAEKTIDVTLLKITSAPGAANNGDVLATDGAGNLRWVAQVTSIELQRLRAELDELRAMLEE
jgi:hypothetical protein